MLIFKFEDISSAEKHIPCSISFSSGLQPYIKSFPGEKKQASLPCNQRCQTAFNHPIEDLDSNFD
jgi:hypothetical protein